MLSKYCTQVAGDIANLVGDELRELLACLPADPFQITAGIRGLDLGNALITALNFELDGTKKPRRDIDENQKIYKNVLSKLGI